MITSYVGLPNCGGALLSAALMNAIYIPASNAEQWAPFLAEPKHWCKGRSARTLAYSWQEAQGFPDEVASVFRGSSHFSDIQLLLAVPEHQVALPGGARPSQSDIWALARSDTSLVSIAVEGKVDETFGPTLAEWLVEASPGKATRLAFLQEQLTLPGVLPGAVRYQLLHRTASAIIEARRFCATKAIMLVHSFAPAKDWFEDYSAFAGLFGVDAQPDRVLSAGNCAGVDLHLAWVSGNHEYLSR
jgi:hypothetical protein